MENQIVHLQVILEELGDGFIADSCTKDITSHSSRTVTFSAMIHGNYHRFFETVKVLQGAVERDGQSLIAVAALAMVLILLSVYMANRSK